MCLSFKIFWSDGRLLSKSSGCGFHISCVMGIFQKLEGWTDIEFKKKNDRREEKRNEPKPEMKICQNERKKKRNEKDAKNKK